MATTLAALRTKVRAGLRDSVQPYHVQTDEVDEAIRAAMTVVSGKVPLGEKWVAGVITLTTGSDTATLPSTYEYHMVYALRRTSDGEPLTKRTVEEMELLYWAGETVSSKTPEEPSDYCLTEDETGLVTVRFQAPVKTAGTLDMRRAVLPSDLTAETDAAPLTTPMEQAVADFAVSDLVGKLTKNELDQLRLDRSYRDTVAQRATSCLKDELIRRAGLESTGRVHRSVP
jgi:hypothetical protein